MFRVQIRVAIAFVACGLVTTVVQRPRSANAGPSGTTSSSNSGGVTEVASTQVELIEVFTQTGQALVFNKRIGQYELVRVGSKLIHWEVAAIGKHHLELDMGQGKPLRLDQRGPVQASSEQPRRQSGHTRDPYTTASTTASPGKSTTLLDPYPVKTPLAKSMKPPAVVNIVRAPVASRAPVGTSKTILSASELDTALANLEQLGREIELRSRPDGFWVTSIGRGSLPYRLGLRRGDLIRRVANIRTTRMEDGAEVFVKLSEARSFTVEITRGGLQANLEVIVSGR